MKAMKQKHYSYLLVAALLLSAPLARAEVMIGIEGQPCVIGSTIDAGTTAAAYAVQWYRNGVAIPGCTAQVCTVPDTLAKGDSVVFVRKITAENCVDNEGWSNQIAITFKCGGGHGTRIDGLCWADRNVDAAGAFTATPDAHGRYYQWNRNRGWTASEPATGWVTSITDPEWTITPLPCPVGWELPTPTNFADLDRAGGGTGANGSTAGSTWAAVNDKGNAVAGRFFGSNHATCRLDGSMLGCVFLPASGNRNSSDGTLNYQGSGSYYWSSDQNNSSNGYYLGFSSGSSSSGYAFNKATGFSVRCVFAEDSE